MTVNINAANISSVQLAAAQTPSAPSAGFVRLHHNANSRLAMRPATGNVVEFLGNTSGSGAGITFPATQSPSTDANTLDDYEEGPWTPTYVPSGSAFSPAPTYDSSTTGRYTKIGNVVHLFGRIQTDSISGGTGNIAIGGLPYPSTTASNISGTIAIGDAGSFAGEVPLSGVIATNASQILLYYRTAVDGGVFNIVVADLNTGANGNLIIFTAMYMTN